ncbi:MAG: ORF6N domain-containing protein [Paludibacteraceae bacterium]|nr:ORF6N domain-containing protein [Paludibacteraceae bacterium]
MLLQIVISKTSGRGGSRYLPFAFTAEGVSMLEKVLKRSIPIEFEEEVNTLVAIPETGLIYAHTQLKDLIYNIRGERVLLDIDLARIYGYSTKAFNQQVKNNIERFDLDFMFQLTKKECEQFLRSKILTSKTEGRGGRQYKPYAFTEQGVYMLTSVLKGDLATRQSKMLIRAFKAMKDFLYNNPCLASGCKMQYYIEQQDEKINTLKDRMDNMVTRAEFKDIVQGFTDFHQGKDILIHNNSIQEANMVYLSIYAEAVKTIFIVDNYIGVRTIELLLSSVRNGVEVTIFSENVGNHLTKSNLEKALYGRNNLSIRFRHNGGIYHDRYIMLDYNTNTEKIYDCGCSSKDAGMKITSINGVENKNMYHHLIDELLQQPELVLKV